MIASPGSAARRARLPRSFSTKKPSKPLMTIAIPDDLPGTHRLAQQQERPDDGEGRLGHLGDPDRADLDRLLREHQQAVGSDPGEERE